MKVGNNQGRSTILPSEPRNPNGWRNFIMRFSVSRKAKTFDTLCVTDGAVDLLIRRTTNHSYMSMRQGLDHFGFAVESLEDAKRSLAEFAASFPQAAPKDIAGGVFGHITKARLTAEAPSTQSKI